MQHTDDQVAAKLTLLLADINQRCKGAKLLPDYGNYKFDGRYAVSPTGQITDLHTGAELFPDKTQGQVCLMVVNSSVRTLKITAQRAVALAFFGPEAVGNKKVHLINHELPLSPENLQVCKSRNSAADGVALMN